MGVILVINAGSSSVKFQVFTAGGRGGLDRVIRGQIDGIATHPRLRANAADGTSLIDRTYTAREVPNVPAAMALAGGWLRDERRLAPTAVGHRVVHGGPDYAGPVRIDPGVLAKLERYVSLAPLHQPNNLAPIRTILSSHPDLLQVACFDTAFHRTHDALADHYAIPLRFYAEGIRRYGFHGLSYEFVADRLETVAPEIARGRVIVAHLGSGASMCALADGRSVESSMGFTALDGLPMGTRPGQLDPGVVLYLASEKQMSAAQIQTLLYSECGLKGLSGISNDVRDLEASDDPKAHFALDYFAYRAGLQAGALAAALGGLDAFVFTAGIGENSAAMRRRIVHRLTWLGAELDEAANAAGRTVISTPGSKVRLLVVPTDEELTIARHTVALMPA
jgi:acetate kinase